MAGRACGKVSVVSSTEWKSWRNDQNFWKIILNWRYLILCQFAWRQSKEGPGKFQNLEGTKFLGGWTILIVIATELYWNIWQTISYQQWLCSVIQETYKVLQQGHCFGIKWCHYYCNTILTIMRWCKNCFMFWNL